MMTALKSTRSIGFSGGLILAGWLANPSLATGDPPCYYQVTVLDLIPNCAFGTEPSSTTPLAIADNGWITGRHPQCNGTGFSWVMLNTGGTAVQELIPEFDGVLRAEGRGISSNSVIVGTMDISGEGQRGFIREGEDWMMLNPLLDGPHSGAFSVSESGQYVCGYRSNSDGFWRATLWVDGLATEIPTTLGPRSIANDVNEQGEVVGWMGTSVGIDSHPFFFTGDEIIDVGLLPDGLNATALSINDAQVVVDGGDVPTWEGKGRATHAFIYSNGVMNDIGGLPGFRFSGAWDINNSNTVVGFSSGTLQSINERKAFIWENGQLTALEDLVDPTLELEFLEAHSINNKGQIAANAVSDDLIISFAVVLTPPNPADTNGDCIVNFSDLIMLLGDWGLSESPADLDGNGVVDVLDLLFLLGHWGFES